MAGRVHGSERTAYVLSATARPTTTTSAPSSAATPTVTARPGIDQAPDAPRYPLPGAAGPVVDGIDWREPDWLRPAANSVSTPNARRRRTACWCGRSIRSGGNCSRTRARRSTPTSARRSRGASTTRAATGRAGRLLDAHFPPVASTGSRPSVACTASSPTTTAKRTCPSGTTASGGICSISIARSSSPRGCAPTRD